MRFALIVLLAACSSKSALDLEAPRKLTEARLPAIVDAARGLAKAG